MASRRPGFDVRSIISETIFEDQVSIFNEKVQYATYQVRDLATLRRHGRFRLTAYLTIVWSPRPRERTPQAQQASLKRLGWQI